MSNFFSTGFSPSQPSRAIEKSGGIRGLSFLDKLAVAPYINPIITGQI